MVDGSSQTPQAPGAPDASPDDLASVRELFPSIILPVCQFDGGLEGYLTALSAVIEAWFDHYEILVVDDGSRDRTLETVIRLQKSIPGVTLLGLSSRRGVDVATVAGLEHAIGDIAIVLDPRSDPPDLVLAMVLESLRGSDIVYAVPRDKTDSSLIADAVTRKFLRFVARAKDVDLPLANVTARLVSRAVLNFMLKPANRHRILALSPALSGYSFATISYQPQYRSGAKPGSGLLGAIARSISLTFALSPRPLRAVSLLALASSGMSVLYSIYIILYWLFAEEVAPGWTSISLQVSGLFFFVCLVLAVMSEYLLQVLESIGGRPAYYIAHLSHSARLTYDEQLNVLRAGDGEQAPAHKADLP